jgi:hypothetical protein
MMGLGATGGLHYPRSTLAPSPCRTSPRAGDRRERRIVAMGTALRAPSESPGEFWRVQGGAWR